MSAPLLRDPSVSPAKRRLVLLGGGHAHLHLLRRAAQEPIAGTELLLVSADRRQHYSGMAPGFLQGTYSEHELAVDLEPLARRAGARFEQATASRIEVAERRIETDRGEFGFDLLSLDVGSAPAGMERPGVREHAFTVRPMARVVDLRTRAEEIFTPGAGPVEVSVVGGGAAGIEVALALERLGRTRGARPSVTIFEAMDTLLQEFSARVRRLALRVLAARGIAVSTGSAVVAVEPERLLLAAGGARRADLTVWMAGAAPPRVLAGSALPKDDRGFFQVDATLRAVDGSPLFGAGDCIGIEGHPALAKAGVYAVREAPILDANVRAALRGLPLRRYRPQSSFLALLNTADGRALWRWHGLSGHGRTAWWLKDRIDRGFIARYREDG